jgi:hypothetical protein
MFSIEFYEPVGIEQYIINNVWNAQLVPTFLEIVLQFDTLLLQVSRVEHQACQ